MSGLHDERRVGVQRESPPCPHEHLPQDTNGLQWVKGNKGRPKPSEGLLQREDAAKEHMGAVLSTQGDYKNIQHPSFLCAHSNIWFLESLC